VMNYSMVSKKMILNADLKLEDNLRLKNTISEELLYMRSHILPSLYLNIKNNQGKADKLRFFEIAKTYKKRKEDLPVESYKLAIVVNTSYSDLKGIVEALLIELNIDNWEINKTEYTYLDKYVQSEISKSGSYLARIGQVNQKYQSNFGINKQIFAAVLDLKTLLLNYKPLARYSPINSYAVIKLDQTFENKTYDDLKNLAFKSNLLQKIEVVSLFKNKVTLRFYYSSKDKNITEEEAKKELLRINL